MRHADGIRQQYMHPSRPSPALLHPTSSTHRGRHPTHDPPLGHDKVLQPTVLDLVPALSVSQIYLKSQDAAPGRCRRPPALRALELLGAIDGAGVRGYAL